VICKILLPVLVLFASAAHTSDIPALPSAHEILSKAVDRAKCEKETHIDDRYGFTQRTVEEKLDKAGNPEERTERVYRTVLIEGKPFRRLIEKNGAPLSAGDLKKEAEREKKFREHLRKQKKPDDDGDEDVEFDNALISRYQFHVLRKEPLGARQAYVLSFLPKTGTKLPDKKRIDRVLNRLEGMVWIVAKAYSMLKLDMHLTEPTSFIGGIANVRKMDFFLEQAEVFPDYVAPTALNIALEGRRLFSNMNVKQSAVFSDYFLLAPMTAHDEMPKTKKD
jgi:hypothetical protein